jgi:hypothetical protein
MPNEVQIVETMTNMDSLSQTTYKLRTTRRRILISGYHPYKEKHSQIKCQGIGLPTDSDKHRDIGRD